jgi:hypothetical protein
MHSSAVNKDFLKVISPNTTVNSATENEKFIVKVWLMNTINYGDDILLIKPERLRGQTKNN